MDYLLKLLRKSLLPFFRPVFYSAECQRVQVFFSPKSSTLSLHALCQRSSGAVPLPSQWAAPPPQEMPTCSEQNHFCVFFFSVLSAASYPMLPNHVLDTSSSPDAD